VAIQWTGSYEAPISLDASRMLGTRARRPTLWTVVALVLAIPLLVCCFWLQLPWLAPLAVLWLLVCYVFATSWGQRPAEYWLRVMARHRRLPRRCDRSAVATYHAPYLIRGHTVVDVATQTPRGVVELEQTANLRLADDETLGGTIKRLGLFLNGLRFPIQIVVRATLRPDGLIERHWYVATIGTTDAVLHDNLEAIVSGLQRAGLKGHALNGGLFDALQACWTSASRGDVLGPHLLERDRRYVRVDDDYVRGFLLAKMPRTVEPNWLAPLLDGDLPIDFSLWLDPTENADEVQYLADRIVEWQTAQVLYANRGGIPDPDLDDSINDAKRTRLLLRRRELRVFRATMGFVVRAPNQETLHARERELAIHVREQVGDDGLVPLDWEHDRAIRMVVPLGEPSVEWPLRTVTPAVARGYPFSNSSVNHTDGVDVGTSVGSKRQNRLNLFSLPNPHMVVLGTSGAGKGYWIKVFLWRLLHAYPWAQRIRVFVIQVEKDEYSALAEAMEHDDLGLSGMSPRGEVVRIHNLGDIEQLSFGIGVLRPYRDLTVFDLTPLESKERGVGVAMLLRAIEEDMRNVRRRRHAVCVVDELGIVLESDEAAKAIEIAYRRFRSIPWHDDPREVNRVAMIGASQRPSDLLKHPRGKVLADLAMTHLYFRQKSTELKGVAGLLNLSTDEQTFLDGAEQGTGLLVADLARVGIHLQASELEKGFAET
jgi:hypothetical protein